MNQPGNSINEREYVKKTLLGKPTKSAKWAVPLLRVKVVAQRGCFLKGASALTKRYKWVEGHRDPGYVSGPAEFLGFASWLPSRR
jgi:hypothetical protein